MRFATWSSSFPRCRSSLAGEDLTRRLDDALTRALVLRDSRTVQQAVNVNPKGNARLAILSLATVIIVTASVFLGQGWRSPAQILLPENAAVLELRLWRVLAGVVVGAALAVSGAVLQAVLRNPLAEPYVLGLSSGAALGTAVAITGGMAAPWILPAFGFTGAMVSLAVVLALAAPRGRLAPSTLILAGVVWSSLCGSVLMYLVSQSSAEGMHAVMWWFLGDLQVFDRHLILTVASIIGFAGILLVPHLRTANALMLGDEAAYGVGLRPKWERARLLAIASLLAASAVAASGLIAFVGLTAPHVARALVGGNHRKMVPAAALIGAAFLPLADGFGRMVQWPVEVPVGVITAMVGAPFFLLLLRKRSREMWL